MSTLFWAVCSASVGGSVLFMLADLICRLLKHRLDARAQFLLWLLVVIRFAALASVPDGLLNVAVSWSVGPPALHVQEMGNVPVLVSAEDDASVSSADAPVRTGDMLGFLWLSVAVVLLIVRISGHTAFMRRLRRSEPSSDLKLLNVLAQCVQGEEGGTL